MTTVVERTVALEVVEIATDEVIHRFPVASRSERQIEVMLRGLLRNMDTDKFFVREVSK